MFYTRTRLVDKNRQISFPWNYLLKKYVVLLIVIADERSGSRCVGVLTPLQCTLITEKLYVFAYVNLADTLKRENKNKKHCDLYSIKNNRHTAVCVLFADFSQRLTPKVREIRLEEHIR